MGTVFMIKRIMSYDKQCCDEHWGAYVSFRSGFLSVYAQKWYCWVINVKTSAIYLVLNLHENNFSVAKGKHFH